MIFTLKNCDPSLFHQMNNFSSSPYATAYSMLPTACLQHGPTVWGKRLKRSHFLALYAFLFVLLSYTGPHEIVTLAGFDHELSHVTTLRCIHVCISVWRGSWWLRASTCCCVSIWHEDMLPLLFGPSSIFMVSHFFFSVVRSIQEFWTGKFLFFVLFTRWRRLY